MPMAQLMWIVVLLVIVTAIQLGVYFYLGGRRGRSTFDAPSADAGPPTGPSDRAGSNAADDDASGRRCPTCGAVNEPSYTFCRGCASRIGA